MFKFSIIFLLCCKSVAASSIDQEIVEALKQYDVPGVAVAVVTDKSVLLSKGYGYRDRACSSIVTEHTLFGIGSCTKAFTALVLEQLIDEGKAQWDDPVIQYLPQFRLYDPILSQQVTLLDLIAHQTAVSRNDPLWVLQECPKAAVLPLLPYFEPAGEFRKCYVYNNFMYAVAGLVIEAITGNSWEDELKSRILQPLEMTDSEPKLAHRKKAAHPHADDELSYAKLDALLPACGIYSSACDMAKWLQLHLRAEIDNKRYAVVNPHGSYARGWIVGGLEGEKMLSHGGLIQGFVSEVVMLPEKKMAVAVLTNSSKRGHFVISSVLNILLDMPKRGFPKEHEPILPASLCHPIDDYIGTYSHPAYGTVVINKELELAYGSERIHLEPISEDCFRGRVEVLDQFGMPSTVEFRFVRTDRSIELHIPFEGLYDTNPIVFTKGVSLADGGSKAEF